MRYKVETLTERVAGCPFVVVDAKKDFRMAYCSLRFDAEEIAVCLNVVDKDRSLAAGEYGLVRGETA